MSNDLWPFDKEYTSRISRDLITTDGYPGIMIFQAIEITVYDIPIFLIIRIGRTTDDELGITELTPDEMSDKCTLSSTEISREKYTISWNKIKYDFIKIFFFVNNILLYVFLHL
jgi:hypothetical protein